MDNPQAGRPKNTDRIPSQGEEPRVRHCGRCGEAGHQRGQCKQPVVPNEMLNKRKAYQRKKKSANEQQENPPPFNSYPTQTIHDTYPANDTYETQPYYQNFYPTGLHNQGETSHEQHGQYNQSHGYDQYDSQAYPSQHLNDINTQQSNNSWFNLFG